MLAAGDGTRLRALTTDALGRSVPKQFCSLRGGQTLLGATIERAKSVAPTERICTIVAEDHRDFWEDELEDLPQENVIVQTRNRGTAPGLLLPLLTIVERDPLAQVLVLPSDHHVSDERVMARALRDALRDARLQPDCVHLLGIEPDSPETEYGWIVAQWAQTGTTPVSRFVEKPPAELAAELHSAGATWNSFLMAASVATMIGLVKLRQATLLKAFQAAFELRGTSRARALEDLYASLEAVDFSRSVLQGSESHLRVRRVPPCGWTDLGTPRRVRECLQREVTVPVEGLRSKSGWNPVLERALAGIDLALVGAAGVPRLG